MDQSANSLKQEMVPNVGAAWRREDARVAITEWKTTGLPSSVASCPAGTKVFERGAESRDVFLLDRGVIAFEREQPDKERSGIFALCLPGSLFGQSTDAATSCYPYSAVALTECVFYRIAREKILLALQHGGETALFIIRQYLQNLLCARARATESALRSAKIRFRRLLQELALVLEGRGPAGSICLPLQDKEMAGLLGISPQQFSVIKKEMEEEKLIECSGQRNRLSLRSVSGTLQFFKVPRYKRISNVASVT
jgi:CRP-like cAMP-binding protein